MNAASAAEGCLFLRDLFKTIRQTLRCHSERTGPKRLSVWRLVGSAFHGLELCYQLLERHTRCGRVRLSYALDDRFGYPVFSEIRTKLVSKHKPTSRY